MNFWKKVIEFFSVDDETAKRMVAANMEMEGYTDFEIHQALKAWDKPE
jgi:hypothetical protein